MSKCRKRLLHIGVSIRQKRNAVVPRAKMAYISNLRLSGFIYEKRMRGVSANRKNHILQNQHRVCWRFVRLRLVDRNVEGARPVHSGQRDSPPQDGGQDGAEVR